MILLLIFVSPSRGLGSSFLPSMYGKVKQNAIYSATCAVLCTTSTSFFFMTVLIRINCPFVNTRAFVSGPRALLPREVHCGYAGSRSVCTTVRHPKQRHQQLSVPKKTCLNSLHCFRGQ